MSFLGLRQYDRRVGVIAIPLLTLVPGRLGGSETYVRELLRGLGRSGTYSYRVVLPPVAPKAGEGLPAVVAREYRGASSTPERLLAMGLASARPGRLAAHLSGSDVVHFPLTIELPRTPLPKVVTLHDVQHLDLPHRIVETRRVRRRRQLRDVEEGARLETQGVQGEQRAVAGDRYVVVVDQARAIDRRAGSCRGEGWAASRRRS